MSVMGCAEVREVAPEFALGVLDGDSAPTCCCTSTTAPRVSATSASSRRRPTRSCSSRRKPNPRPDSSAEFSAAWTIPSRRRRWRTDKIGGDDGGRGGDPQRRDGARSSTKPRNESTSVAAPAVGTVEMVGAEGQKVGSVDVVADGTLASLNVSVVYALPDGTYRVVLKREDTARQGLGNIQVVNNRGTWSGTARVEGAAKLALVDDTGRTLCSAELPTA